MVHYRSMGFLSVRTGNTSHPWSPQSLELLGLSSLALLTHKCRKYLKILTHSVTSSFQPEVSCVDVRGPTKQQLLWPSRYLEWPACILHSCQACAQDVTSLISSHTPWRRLLFPFDRCKRVDVLDLFHCNKGPFTSSLCTSQARAWHGVTSKEANMQFFYILQIKFDFGYRVEDGITAV